MAALHIFPGANDPSCGIAVAAKKLIEHNIGAEDEIWIHGAWLPFEWFGAWMALRKGRRLVRMPHGSFDPLRLRFHGFRKRLAAPIERCFLRRANKVVATCEEEADWIRSFEPCVRSIEVINLKRFFNLSNLGKSGQTLSSQNEILGQTYNLNSQSASPIPHLSAIASATADSSSLHLLYLGRQHPLKGLEFLEEAVRQISSVPHSPFPVPPQLKVVSNAFGDELEKVWNWCDVLILPTLSENFGLVIAEALERGKRVITTDGAPAWGDDCECKMENEKCKIGEGEIWSGYEGRLTYIKGYRDGSAEERIALLKSAIEWLVGSC